MKTMSDGEYFYCDLMHTFDHQRYYIFRRNITYKTITHTSVLTGRDSPISLFFTFFTNPAVHDTNNISISIIAFSLAFA